MFKDFLIVGFGSFLGGGLRYVVSRLMPVAVGFPLGNTPNIKLIKKAVDKYKARVTMTCHLVDNENGKDIMVSSIDSSDTADDQIVMQLLLWKIRTYENISVSGFFVGFLALLLGNWLSHIIVK